MGTADVAFTVIDAVPAAASDVGDTVAVSPDAVGAIAVAKLTVPVNPAVKARELVVHLR